MDIIAGKYEIIREIGSGGSATVLLANHIALQQEVVLKKLFSTGGDTEISRLEIDILKNLQHEHLPRVYDFVVEDGHAYSVMEYISGKSLDKLVEEGYIFKESEVIQWAKELCDTLAYMHRQKPAVLHCDIKPSNIILSESGKIYLIDFNISSYIERNQSNTYGYTPNFASPEQKRLADKKVNSDKVVEIDETVLLSEAADKKSGAEDLLDERTDIYSLGATIFYLLSGISPNSKEGFKKGKNKLRKKIRKILKQSLQEDREKRYQSAKSMLQSLNKMKKTRRGLIWGGLLLFLIMVSIICFFPVKLEHTPDLAEQAAAFFRDGEYEQAVLLYQELAENSIDSVFYYVKISDCYYYIGNADRALEYMQNKYSENPHELYRNKILEYLMEKCQRESNIEKKVVLEEQRIQLGERTEELYLDLLQFYTSQADYDMVKNYITQIKEEKLNIDVERYEEMLALIEEYQTKFHDLYVALPDYDESTLYSLCYNGDYYKMVRLMGQPLFYSEGEDVLGIYNNGFLYFGEMVDGIRQGRGQWVGVGRSFNVYDGEWENDLPNGHGVFAWDSYDGLQEYESDVIDGIMNGKCEVVVLRRIDGTLSDSGYTYTYVNEMGYPQNYIDKNPEDLLAEHDEFLHKEIFKDIPENYITVAKKDMDTSELDFFLSPYVYLPSNELQCVFGLGLQGE